MNLHCYIFLKLPMGRKTCLSNWHDTPGLHAQSNGQVERVKAVLYFTMSSHLLYVKSCNVTFLHLGGWVFPVLPSPESRELFGPWKPHTIPAYWKEIKTWNQQSKKPVAPIVHHHCKNGGDIHIISYSSIYILHMPFSTHVYIPDTKWAQNFRWAFPSTGHPNAPGVFPFQFCCF